MSSRDKIQSIIERSIDEQKSWKKEFYLFGKLFYVQEPFVGMIDVQNIIDEIEKKIPSEVFNEIDTIMVGSYDFLEERELEAAYKDGAIYISNHLFTDDDLLENIIHETAHSLEAALGHFIYGDHRVLNEFLGKRDTLKRILDARGFKTDSLNFNEVEYDKEFDEFLYKEVGYAMLNNLTLGLVSNPYSLTSLREYWASGFEKYFLGEREEVKTLSPQLFIKIEGVLNYDS